MSALNVVALATNVPGPLAAEHFAKAGHRVVKVEPPQGDPLEQAAPRWYERIVQGMTVQRLDLKNPAALEQLHALLAPADLFITTVRPRALARLGLEGAAVTSRYPRLCHLAITGESGEGVNSAGHDLTYQARSGLLAPPAMPRTVYADMFAAEGAVAMAYAMLYERESTGTGGTRTLAIADGVSMLADGLRYGLTSPDGPLGGASPVYRMYRASDGWIVLAALEPHFQMNLKTATGLSTLDAASLEALFALRTCAQWEELALQHDLPIASVAGSREGKG